MQHERAVKFDFHTGSEALDTTIELLATPTIPPMARQPFSNALPDVVVLAVRGLCGNQIYGAFVLNRRVDLHAIDATPARWRGDVGSSPLDGASAATSSPRNDLVKNFRMHPTHRLIFTQVPARILRRVPAALCPRRAREEAGRGETAPRGAPARPQRRRLVARRPCPCCTDFSVVVASIGGGALPLASMA